ncbi:hypothetical protein PIB30_021230 [Stylosanthes scabra]|uniref:Uncharacterized protein n=1 Tax=Stylosanthes scabra TaxID=79078 RepID=A0ABU6VAD4_9FABA|nr:hypothetical protein [Stylosanthes scabra]
MEPKPKKPSMWEELRALPVKYSIEELCDISANIPDDFIIDNRPPDTQPVEISEDEYEDYLENFLPYPALAMKYYNNNVRNDKEEEYRISHLAGMDKTRNTYYGELGFLRHVFWEAVPKTPGAKIKIGDSSTVGAKIFYARVHEMPSDIHLPYCGIYSESVDLSERCEICGLQSSEEFHKKAQEIKAMSKEIEDKKEKNIKYGFFSHIIPFPYMYQALREDKQPWQAKSAEGKTVREDFPGTLLAGTRSSSTSSSTMQSQIDQEAEKGIPVSNSTPKSDINEGASGPPNDERIAIIKEKEESIANLLSALKLKEKEMAEIKKQIQELQSQVEELRRVKS